MSNVMLGVLVFLCGFGAGFATVQLFWALRLREMLARVEVAELARTGHINSALEAIAAAIAEIPKRGKPGRPPKDPAAAPAKPARKRTPKAKAAVPAPAPAPVVLADTAPPAGMLSGGIQPAVALPETELAGDRQSIAPVRDDRTAPLPFVSAT